MSPQDLTSPTALPRGSWTETLKRTATEFKDDKLNHWGAALTYYAVLSIFPALLVLVSLVGLFAEPARVTKVLTDTISAARAVDGRGHLPGADRVAHLSRGTAGIMFIVGIASALWAASGYVSAFADACNTIYEVDEGRPFWKLKPLQLLVTFVIIMLAAIVALALVLSGPDRRGARRLARHQRHRPDAMALREVAGHARARPGDLRRPLLHDARTPR